MSSPVVRRLPLPSTPAPDLSEPVVATLLNGAQMSPDAILVVRAGARGEDLEDAVVVWANRAAGELLRWTCEELQGRAVGRLLAPLQEGRFRPQLLRRERGATAPLAVQRADGTRVDVLVRALPCPVASLWSVSLSSHDLAAERSAREQLEAQETRFTTLLERSPVPTVLSDAGTRLAHVNDAFCDLVGAVQESLLGTGWIAHVHDEDLPVVLQAVQTVLEGEPTEVPARFLRTDGRERWVHLRLTPTSNPRHGAGFIGTAEDVTERRAFEQQLSHQARHDALTGLPNRLELVALMSRSLRAGDGPAPSLTCMFLDLDNFKAINDSLGHDAGDRLLVAVAERLRSVVRSTDVVARWGGDEFVVLCAGPADDAAALSTAEQVSTRLREGVLVDGVRFAVTASIGVSRASGDRVSPEEVLQDCDIAMYRAKRAGRDRVALCDASARQEARDALLLLVDLRHALEERRLTVEYQPVVDLERPRALPAVEALVRWHHPRRGQVPPEVLVRTAEANGLVDVLGMYVLREACRQMVTWQADLAGQAPERVNVNVSAIQLHDPRLVDDVAAVLRETGMAAERLCLEVTESALMQEPTLSRQRLSRLRDMGIRIALDDFGTGYSSLAALRQLPVDYLKVDRTFVAELREGHPEVVSAVISLAHSLGLTAVAEGVEHADQIPVLRSLGATLVQGWYYARAMTSADLVRWRREHAGRQVAP